MNRPDAGRSFWAWARRLSPDTRPAGPSATRSFTAAGQCTVFCRGHGRRRQPDTLGREMASGGCRGRLDAAQSPGDRHFGDGYRQQADSSPPPLAWIFPDGCRFLGDHWERSYGDLEWRGQVGERLMPWYFLASGANTTHGYGVRTGAASICYWQADAGGITLWLDVSNGGGGVELAGRRLEAATIVVHHGHAGESGHGRGAVALRHDCANSRGCPRSPSTAAITGITHMARTLRGRQPEGRRADGRARARFQESAICGDRHGLGRGAGWRRPGGRNQQKLSGHGRIGAGQ